MKEIAKIKNVQDRFLEFVVERENCRHCKEMGIFPHTEDPILQVNKFCNINREHDTVTKWVKKHVRDDHSLSFKEMVSSLLVARIFNNPSALKTVIPLKDLQTVSVNLKVLKAEGKAVFRGAYMMVVHGKEGKGKNAIDFYCQLVKKVSEGVTPRIKNSDSLEVTANHINSTKGLGVFMANQVVTDLRYTRFFPRVKTIDWESFVWPGPGTLRGVRRYYGADVSTGRNSKGSGPSMINVGSVPRLLLKIREELKTQLPFDINKHFEDPNNLSNSFCEFDKYERVLGLVPSGSYRKATLRKYKYNL